MTPLVDQDWLDRQRAATADLPERRGATARIQYEISDGTDGSVVFHTHLQDGRIVVNELGPAEDPDFTVRIPGAEFPAIARGDEDVSVGFMQGRIKVVGNIGRMLSILPVTTSDPWRAAMASITGCTD